MLRSKTRFLWSFQSNSFNMHLPYTFYMLYLVGETQRCAPQSAGGDIPTKHSNMVSAVPEVCVRSYEILEEKLINDFRRNLKNSLSQAAWKLSFESWEVLEATKAILESGKGTCILSKGSGWLARGRTEEKQGWGGRVSWTSSPTGRKWQSKSWPVIWLDLFFKRIFLEAML